MCNVSFQTEIGRSKKGRGLAPCHLSQRKGFTHLRVFVCFFFFPQKEMGSRKKKKGISEHWKEKDVAEEGIAGPKLQRPKGSLAEHHTPVF